MISLQIQEINNNTFSNLFGDIYVKFSDKNLSNTYEAPKELEEYIKYVCRFFNIEDVKITEKQINEKYNFEENKKVLVAYSGGKDSLANAINLSNQGYTPIMTYIKGLNRSYPNEYKAVKEVADKLNFELVVIEIKVSGKCDYIENPIKNAFILSMLVDYGKTRNINKYSFGNLLEDEAEKMPTEAGLSDGLEFFNILEKFYSNYIENFKIITTLKNQTYSYKTIIDKDIDLLNYTQSCMMPYRYIKQFHDKNEKKYNFKFKTNSCGCSCYKCCRELYVLDKLGKIKLTKELEEQCFKMFKLFDKRNNMHTIWFDEDVLNKE